MKPISFIFLMTILAAVSGCEYAPYGYNRKDDLAFISRHLKAPRSSIECERITIDNSSSRPLFCVFFHAKNVPLEAFAATFKDYREVSLTRRLISFHFVYWKNLKHMKWGPYDDYEQLPEYVGYWDNKYVVYIAYENGTVHGCMEYMENRRSVLF